MEQLFEVLHYELIYKKFNTKEEKDAYYNKIFQNGSFHKNMFSNYIYTLFNSSDINSVMKFMKKYDKKFYIAILTENEFIKNNHSFIEN